MKDISTETSRFILFAKLVVRLSVSLLEHVMLTKHVIDVRWSTMDLCEKQTFIFHVYGHTASLSMLYNSCS